MFLIYFMDLLFFFMHVLTFIYFEDTCTSMLTTSFSTQLDMPLNHGSDEKCPQEATLHKE